jgi:hypothetical protein
MNGEITFKIGDEDTAGGPATCAFLPRGVPHAWKNTGAETVCGALRVHSGRGRRVFRGGDGAADRVSTWIGGQRYAVPARLGDRGSAAFLT